MKRTAYVLLAVLLLTMIPGSLVLAAGGKQPIELTADVIEYDDATGLVKAKGSVVLKQTGTTITGPQVEYNKQTGVALVTGGVKAVNQDSTLTADQLRVWVQQNKAVATGKVVMLQQNKRLYGNNLEYDQSSQHAVVTGNAKVEDGENTITAPTIEAMLKAGQDTIVGRGGVKIINPSRNFESISNEASYFTTEQKVILTGDARAVQGENVLTGQTLTILLDQKTLDAIGRPKLVIYPEEKNHANPSK